jgi:AcrR family transcriptional regulator
MSNNPKKLDPRVVRTRYLLREALMTLIPEMGYDTITVQDITDRATLNRATFYLHYRDKQDLLTQIIESVLGELADLLTRSQTISENIHQTFVRIFEHVASHAPFYRVILEESSVAPYLLQMQTHIQAIGMQALLTGNRDAKDMITPPDLFIAFIGWAYLGVVRWWVLNGMPCSADYLAAQFVRLAVGGIQREFGLSVMIGALEDQLRATRTL